MVKTVGFNTKNKHFIKYPNIPSAICPVAHLPEVSTPSTSFTSEDMDQDMESNVHHHHLSLSIKLTLIILLRLLPRYSKTILECLSVEEYLPGKWRLFADMPTFKNQMRVKREFSEPASQSL